MSSNATISPVNDAVRPSVKIKPMWANIMIMLYLHVSAVYGLYLAIFHAKIYTVIFALLLNEIGLLGVTAGAHRLWAHRSYKATLPLQIILITFHTIAHQGPVIWWSHVHRVHHKYEDTDADPHSIKRGFFYSHIGWVLCRLHPLARQKKYELDASDLKRDPVLRFQKKHYPIAVFILSFFLPTVVPMYFWNENYINAYHINIFRYLLTLHITFLVNSFAHRYGNRPYDRNIEPGESAIIAFLTKGEGWHNYHHAFPWDYKTSELGNYSTNSTKMFLDLMAKIGWAYNMKTANMEMIMRKVQRAGDGTHAIWGCSDSNDSVAVK